MRLLWLETKRILKSRLTICMIMIAMIFSLLMAYVPISFYNCVNPSGNKEYLSGFAALRTMKEIRSDIEGTIEHEDIKAAVNSYQAVTQKYGVDSEYSLPTEGKLETAKYQFLFWRIKEAYGPENGLGANLNTLSADDLDEFYSAVHKHLQNNMKLEQEKYPDAQAKALAMYKKVQTPYSYYVGADTTVFDYEELLIFLILLCCVVVVASVFSTDYQTGADDIFRCAKNGKRKLAATKILSSIIVTLGMSVLCLSVWGVATRVIWGKEGMKTSIQILFSIINLVNLNAGQLMWVLAICGTLMIISCVCLSLFISSCISKNMVSLILSVVICLAPIVLGWILPNYIVDYAKAIFPSGGIGLQNGILFDIIDFKFLNIGPLAIWTPYLILGAAILEIPLWITLTIRSHDKHVSH